jgi:rubrerythrin
MSYEKHNLTNLEDRVLGGFNGDISEALPFRLVEQTWPYNATRSLRGILLDMMHKGLVAYINDKWFLTPKGHQLWSVRLEEESVSPTVRKNLTKSAAEEAKASTTYRERVEGADIATASLYEHIASEEDGHEKEFKARLKELQ